MCLNGAAVNTGIHSGLGVKFNESAPWITLVHSFNHRLELAVKDTFDNTFFKDIDTMLLKLYCLYRKSPKRLRELKSFSQMYENTIPKPYKSCGTRWIYHKLKSVEIVLRNYGSFMQHLESLAQTDSQSLKRVELEGYTKKWMNAKYPIHLAIYLNVKTPLKVLSLGFQKEIHDPVTAVRHITEFNWTMAKLKLLIDHSLEDNATRLTHFTKFLKEKSINEYSEHVYQDVILKNFASARESITRSYD